MKLSSIVAALLVLIVSLYCAPSYAQSTGIAADKQKQENLNKVKARQDKLHKKFNSLTPEQAAEAGKRAEAYKNGGYRNQTGQGTKTSTPAKPAAVTPAKPATNAAVKTKTVQVKPTGSTTPGAARPKPILMDANGKPLNSKTPPAPTSGSKVPKPADVKNNAAQEKAPAVKTEKK